MGAVKSCLALSSPNDAEMPLVDERQVLPGGGYANLRNLFAFFFHRMLDFAYTFISVRPCFQTVTYGVTPSSR